MHAYSDGELEIIHHVTSSNVSEKKYRVTPYLYSVIELGHRERLSIM